MNDHIFVGIDGGASKTIFRLEDASGKLIDRKSLGPSTLRFNPTNIWNFFEQTITSMLNAANYQKSLIHVGIGLAGCEMDVTYQLFCAHRPAFASCVITSDAHIACLGAHNGAEGAVIIAGTGAIGYQHEEGVITRVGGWGFPHDDSGGGAAIGLGAIHATLKAYDGRAVNSALTRAILSHFQGELGKMVEWANHATPAMFASIAPLVISSALEKDNTAIDLLQRGARALTEIYDALLKAQRKPLLCAMVGGIAPYLIPYLPQYFKEALKQCEFPPDVGAILLVKQQMRDLYHA